jgi:hypothetical protein
VAAARLAGRKLTGGAARPWHGAHPPSGACRACTGCMSAMREELHHLADLLPEAGLRPAPGLIRAHAAGDHGPGRDLPFVASSAAGPDLAGRAEQISASEPGR